MEKEKQPLKIVSIILAVAIIVVAALCVLLVVYSIKTNGTQKAKETVAASAEQETNTATTGYVFKNLDLFTLNGEGITAQENTEQDTTTPQADPATGGTSYDQFGDDEYILPGSDSQLLSESALYALDAKTLTYARNEIYARHGKVFRSQELNTYFQGKTWYQADSRFEDNDISDVERTNAELIANYQENNNLKYLPQ